MARSCAEQLGHPPAALQPHRGLRSDLTQGFTDSVSVGLGAIPMGIAFGVLVVHSGLQWWWASVFSGLIFAGSLEFLFLGLVVAAAPLTSVAVTAFLVNFRHAFYALSFPLHRVRGRLGKVYATFALTDEAYAVTAGEPAECFSGRRVLWLEGYIHFYWAGGATAGALLGAAVPDRVAGLDFAVTALFTVLAMDAIRGRGGRRDVATPVLALVCAVAGRFVFPGQMLLAAFVTFTAGLVVRYAWMRRERARHA